MEEGTEAAEIAKELATLERERAWFRSQLASMVSTTLTQLDECLSLLGKGTERPSDMLLPRLEKSAEPLEQPKQPAMSVDDILAQARGGPVKKKEDTPEPTRKEKKKSLAAGADGGDDKMLSFRAPDNSFIGFVVLQGWNCIEAELTVQFQAHHRNASNGTYEIDIRSSRPWRFAQLQNAYLHIEQAIEYCQSNEEENLSVALNEIRLAQEELILPQTRSFPADSRVFHPRLPADVLVDFCIINQDLQAQAVLVRAVAPSKDNRTLPVPLSLAHLKPGDVFSQSIGKPVEVLELSRITCELPRIAKCFHLLSKVMNNLNTNIHNFEALL